MSTDVSEAKNAIKVISPTGCGECGYRFINPYDVHITSIESAKEGWIAHGKRLNIIRRDSRCPACGQYYEAIEYTIPIQCAPFPCPKCGELQNLNYNVCSIKTDEDSFEFEVEIECKKCMKKKSFTKAFTKILEVIMIDVNPTGITVKKD